MLYKFLGPERISVLQNLKIRFTQPCELNDPFESALLVEADCFTGWEIEMEAMAKELNPQTDEDRASIETIKAELREHAKQMMTPQAVGRELAERINRSQGVLSLSRANNNLLMWAHYGASHKGYVIGLDDSHEWFRERNGLGKVTEPHNVIYTSRRSLIRVGTEDFYERLLCYKSIDWAYEEEVRIFRTFGSKEEDFDKHSSDDLHLFNIPRECIKEVFIGANASLELREQIIEAIKYSRLEVSLFQAFINDDRYDLNFHPITVG